jgi:Kef-type K+ transport system membrane component KefB
VNTGVHAVESLLFMVLLQLAIIVLAGRAGAALARRVGQSEVVGEIVVGILLGPSLFGLLAPDVFAYVFRSVPPEPVTILSQIGLLLVMFQIGLEFDFGHLSQARNQKAVAAVAVATLVAPFAIGLGFGYVSAPVLSPGIDLEASALFCATAFSITALPVLGRILIELGIQRSTIGVVAISAAALNDVAGWLMLAVVSTIAVSGFEPGAFALRIGMLAAFIALSWYALRPLMKRLLARLDPGDGTLGHHQMGVLVALVFVCGMATYQLGIFAIFGGFMAGVLLHDDRRLVDAWNARVGQFVVVFFLPVFFTYTGLRTEIGSLASASAWGWCALLVLLATVGKYGGAYLAARWVGLTHVQGNVLGVMMNTRGLMELVVINVGLDLGVISRQMFTMLVIMAVVSTVVTTPLLRRWLPAALASETNKWGQSQLICTSATAAPAGGARTPPSDAGAST